MANVPPTSQQTEPQYGWVVVAGSHVVFALWAGLLKTAGVLLPSLADHYDTTTWVLGWIMAALSATNNIAAVFGSVLSGIIGGRQVAVLGGLMATSGLLLASISTSLLQFSLALTLLTGCGFGMVMCMCKVYLGIYFNERLALASGITTMGVPVGLIIFPALAHFLSRTYSIQGTLLVQGALTMHLVACGALLRLPSGFISHRNGYEQLEGTGKQSRLCLALNTHIAELLDFKLLTTARMWMLILVYTLFAFVNDSWLTFMVSNAMSKGFGGYVATSFSIIAGASAMIFSVLQGILVSRGSAGIRSVTAAATAVGSAALLLNPFLDSYSSMCVAVVMYGVALAVLNPAIVYLAFETMGTDRAAKAFGWMGLSAGIFRILFGFSTGLLYDVTGYYDATFILLGAMLALIVPTLFMDKLVSK